MVSNTIMTIQGQCWSFKNDHTLGNIFFRINYVINKLWSGANQPLRREGDQQLISLVGSGLSHLPHGNGESDLVGWAASQSSTVTRWSALPVTSGFGSACRCNALLKKEVSVSIKPISRQAWRALKLDRVLQTGPPVEQDMFSCGPDTRNTTLGARFLRHIYGLWLWLHWLSQHSLRGSTKISTKLCVTSRKTAAMPVASVPFLSGAAFHNCFETPPCEQPDSSGWLALTLFMDGAAVCTINDIRASVRIIVGFFSFVQQAEHDRSNFFFVSNLYCDCSHRLNKVTQLLKTYPRTYYIKNLSVDVGFSNEIFDIEEQELY